MADRCMLFATAAPPAFDAAQPTNMGLCEVGYHIPAIFKLLVSANSHPCRSLVFDAPEEPIAIVGDATEGLSRLKQLRALIAQENEATEGIDAAIVFLSKPHMRQFPFFVLEPAEIFGLSEEAFAQQIATLVSNINTLRPEALVDLALNGGDSPDWPLHWTNVLYFESEGSVEPPIDPAETFVSTTPKVVLECETLLPNCAAQNISLSFEADDPLLDGALNALRAAPKLVELRLYGACQYLPDSIGSLKGLRTLAMGDMGLTELPARLAELADLDRLYVQQNAFTSFPEVLRSMTRLKSLSLWGNTIRELPDWIGELRALEDVLFERCGISRLPDSFFSLPALMKINLSYNPLRALPDAIGNLRSLKTLSVYQCELGALPETLGRIATLEELFAGGNRLTSISRAMRDMPLQLLSLSGNPIKSRPWTRLNFKAKKVLL